jgi:hypothetical protein
LWGLFHPSLLMRGQILPAVRQKFHLAPYAKIRDHLFQPVGYVNFAVHRRRDSETVMSLPTIARAAIQFAEAEVAQWVDERAHAAGLRFASTW